MVGPKLHVGLAERGPVYSYHLIREYLALHDHRRADVQPHLAARLNALGSNGTSALGAVMSTAGCVDIRDLTHEIVAERRDALTERFVRVSASDALDLYRYFRFFGDFRVAEFLREQTLHAYLRWQGGAPHVMTEALAAAIELGKPEFVLATVNAKLTRPRDRGDVRKATAVAHALCGESSEAQRLWDTVIEDRDVAFRETVRNRRIAVIGPAPVTADLSEELDAFDLVVRTNYVGKLDPRYGSKTDISYYNGTSLANQRERILAVAASLKWLIASRSDGEELIRLVPDHPGVRPAKRVDSVFFQANPLAIPNILLDLTRFQPASIKLFCSDFYSSEVSYDPTYRARPKAHAVAHSLRIHDPFSSFSFAQHMKNAGLVDVDEIAGKVLRIERRQYAARLQQLYGAHPVANRHPTNDPDLLKAARR